jgi:PST family polysaccharide transporter
MKSELHLEKGTPPETNPSSAESPKAVPDANARHLATDHLLSGLRGHAISSSLVTALAQSFLFCLSFGSTMVLARLLAPEEFGLVAMVTTIMGFLRIFNDAGLSTATVQREGITHAQVSNLFWANVILGGAISLLLAVGSPVIAWFYREPRLVGVTLALCSSFLLTSAAVQHLAILRRQMRFKVVGAIQVIGGAVGVFVGIVMAWMKFGYWSLVCMQLAAPLAILILSWTASHWRPQLPKRNTGTWSLLQFGAQLTVSSFIWSLARGSDGLLIGRVYGSAALGLYSRAGTLVIRPFEQFMPWIDAVFVPTLARLQTQPERYRRTVLRAFESIAVGTFYFSGLLLVLAHPLTVVILGHKWEAAAPIFACFTLVALHYPLGSISTWLLTSQGRGRDFLRLSVINSVVMVLAFLAGLRFGPAGVALAFSGSCLLIVMPLQYYYAGRSGPVSARDLWGRFFTHLPVFGVVCGATWLAYSFVLNSASWKQLAFCVPVGLIAGAGFICIYPPARRVALNLVGILNEYRAKRHVS